MQLSADILRGYTDAIILSQLAEGDSYGYRISKQVAEISSGECDMKEATLYSAFKRLETAGLITSRWGDEDTGRRRRYYSITALGMEKLHSEQENWQNTKATLDKLLQGGKI